MIEYKGFEIVEQRHWDDVTFYIYRSDGRCIAVALSEEKAKEIVDNYIN